MRFSGRDSRLYVGGFEILRADRIAEAWYDAGTRCHHLPSETIKKSCGSSRASRSSESICQVFPCGVFGSRACLAYCYECCWVRFIQARRSGHVEHFTMSLCFASSISLSQSSRLISGRPVCPVHRHQLRSLTILPTVRRSTVKKFSNITALVILFYSLMDLSSRPSCCPSNLLPCNAFVRAA